LVKGLRIQKPYAMIRKHMIRDDMPTFGCPFVMIPTLTPSECNLVINYKTRNTRFRTEDWMILAFILRPQSQKKMSLKCIIKSDLHNKTGNKHMSQKCMIKSDLHNKTGKKQHEPEMDHCAHL
jgi:hypothetical protein